MCRPKGGHAGPRRNLATTVDTEDRRLNPLKDMFSSVPPASSVVASV
jgi:hypothetical protein